jgi:predicted nucleic acid-binding protein
VSDLVALDATVLTNFALVNRPDLIERLWPGNAVTTAAAMSEYRAGVASGQLPENCWVDLPVVEMSIEESNLAARLPKNLGAGERACISIAKARGGSLATDDLAARRLARQFEIPVTGTIGILLACFQAGLLTLRDANLLLAQMIAAGYRTPVQRIDELL